MDKVIPNSELNIYIPVPTRKTELQYVTLSMSRNYWVCSNLRGGGGQDSELYGTCTEFMHSHACVYSEKQIIELVDATNL
jgi:hypothetical protein